jgi:hypothetical protein
MALSPIGVDVYSCRKIGCGLFGHFWDLRDLKTMESHLLAVATKAAEEMLQKFWRLEEVRGHVLAIQGCAKDDASFHYANMSLAILNEVMYPNIPDPSLISKRAVEDK